MPANEFYQNGPLQQCVLEWHVYGALDGGTEAPGLELDGNILVQGTLPPEQPYVIEVDGPAGLFNPDGFGHRMARSDRYLMWLRIEPAAFPVPSSFSAAIQDADPGVASLANNVDIDVYQIGSFDAPAFYDAELRLVPQGCALQITGLPDPPSGSFHRITMSVKAATTAKADAMLAEASCCLSES